VSLALNLYPSFLDRRCERLKARDRRNLQETLVTRDHPISVAVGARTSFLPPRLRIEIGIRTVMVWPPIVKFGSGSLRGQLNGAGKPEVNGPLAKLSASISVL